MKGLKGKITLLLILIVSAAAFSVTVFAQGEDEKIYKSKMSFAELKKDFEKAYKDKVNLGALEEREYGTCYGDQLSEDSKVVYDALVENLVENVKDGEEDLIGDKEYDHHKVLKVKKTNTEWNELGGSGFVLYAIMAFDYDYPDAFWIDFNKIDIIFYGSATNPDNGMLALSLGSYWSANENGEDTVEKDDGTVEKGDWWLYENYYTDGYNTKEAVKTDIAAIKTVWNDDIKEQIKDMDVYDKLRFINSYLVDKNRYNQYIAENPAYDADNRIYECVSALIYGNNKQDNALNPVCEGYARAFQLLCKKIGVECALSSGDLVRSETDKEAHMWNYVKMPDNKWYAVDVTENDPIFETEPSKEDIELNKYRTFLVGSLALTQGNAEKKTSPHIAIDKNIVYDGENNDIIWTVGLNYPVLSAEDYDNTKKPDEPKPPVYSVGDINKSGTVDIDDVSALLDLTLNGEPTGYEIEMGDFDSDGIITSKDAALLLKTILEGTQA